MASITISERNALAEILKEEATKREIEAIGKDVNWEDAVQQIARKIAIGALGIEKKLLQLEKLEEQIGELEAKRIDLEKDIRAELPGRIKKKKGYNNCEEYEDACDIKLGICEAINKLTDSSLEAARLSHTTGKKVVAIRRLLDEKLVELQKCKDREELEARSIFKW